MDFSTANLAIVAYGYVRADGTTPDLNSGVTIIHDNPGDYNIILPGDPAQQQPLQLGQGIGDSAVIFGSSVGIVQDLILATPGAGQIVTITTHDLSTYIKNIQCWGNTGYQRDSDFAFVIYRSILPRTIPNSI
jgi:hypothetical protein